LENGHLFILSERRIAKNETKIRRDEIDKEQRKE